MVVLFLSNHSFAHSSQCLSHSQVSAGLYFLKNQYLLVAAAAWFSPFASEFLVFC